MRFVLVNYGGEAATRNGVAGAVAAELTSQAARGMRCDLVLADPSAESEQIATLITGVLESPALGSRAELSPTLPGALPSEGGVDAGDALQERAWSLIEELKQSQAPDATIVLVVSEAAVRALVCRALSMPLAETARFALQPGSISVIEYRTQPRERTLITALNETCHLELMKSEA